MIPTDAVSQTEQPPQASEPQDQLEATVQMSDVEAQAAFKQADIKTEVLNASDFRQDDPVYQAAPELNPTPASDPVPAVPDATVPYVALNTSGADAAEPQFFTESNVSIPDEQGRQARPKHRSSSHSWRPPRLQDRPVRGRPQLLSYRPKSPVPKASCFWRCLAWASFS